MSFTKGKYVKHRKNGLIGIITEVDDFYGMITVKFNTPQHPFKRYATHDERTLASTLHIMTNVEIADFRLAQEKAGLTDSWLE